MFGALCCGGYNPLRMGEELGEEDAAVTPPVGMVMVEDALNLLGSGDALPRVGDMMNKEC